MIFYLFLVKDSTLKLLNVNFKQTTTTKIINSKKNINIWHFPSHYLLLGFLGMYIVHTYIFTGFLLLTLSAFKCHFKILDDLLKTA